MLGWAKDEVLLWLELLVVTFIELINGWRHEIYLLMHRIIIFWIYFNNDSTLIANFKNSVLNITLIIKLIWLDHWFAIALERLLTKVLKEGTTSTYFSAELCLPLLFKINPEILSILASISPLRIKLRIQSSASSSDLPVNVDMSFKGIVS